MMELLTELKTGDGRAITIGQISDIYRDIVSVPIPKSCKITKLSDQTYSLKCRFTAVDVDTEREVSTVKTFLVSEEGDKLKVMDASPMMPACETELCSATSNNGKYRATLKKTSVENQQLLELWDTTNLLKTIDVSKSEAYGQVVTHPQLASMVWSPSGEQDKLMFVARSKQPKHLSFFDPEPKSSGQNSARGQEAIRRDDWGEEMTGISHTVIVILDLADNFQTRVIEVADTSLTRPQWLNGGQRVVSIGYIEEPRKLGLAYCNNRPNKIFVHNSNSGDLDYNIEQDGYCYSAVRVSNSGDKLLYLKNETFGPHFHASEMVIYDTNSKTHLAVGGEREGTRYFVDPQAIAECCFASDDAFTVLGVKLKTDQQIIAFNADTGTTCILSSLQNSTIMDMKDNLVVVSLHGTNKTPSLLLKKFHSEGSRMELEDVGVFYEGHRYEELESETFNVPTSEGSGNFTAILFRPTKFEKTNTLPTVVWAHGGPNGNFSEMFYNRTLFNARLGLQTVAVNYRGSSGVDEEHVQMLCGKIGSMDVDDCLQTIRYLSKMGKINADKLIFSGGSHSGFLACHMSYQKEFKLHSVIMQNPVVDLIGMLATTDIPDWIPSNSLGYLAYKYDWTPSKEELLKLSDRSPMLKASESNVPTLMALGSIDKRVVMHNGLRWIDNLKARGVKTMCKIYPDDHKLLKPSSMIDFAITRAIWKLKYLPK